ncbi:energy transducer TonB [Solitalea sp. MAHUQ-68]|uniref:Energy transducer TonB n=1 Tax=Solitalea agri TaxID=2953739 RepID=A0A9X2EYT8_9SPHI|nr:energy transducer TonB [Solitalea agri]MCO4291432.1 energy transducer TonB [Solitalea agri]
MKNLFTNSNDLTEIVFENRHKEYGAYQLRARYDKTMRRSLFTSVGSLAILGIIAISFRSKADEVSIVDSFPKVVDLTKQYEIVPDKPKEVELPHKADIKPMASTMKNLTPEVVPDNKATDVPPTTDQMQGKVSDTTTIEVPDGGQATNVMPDEKTGNNGGGNGSSEATTETTFIHAEVMPEYEGGFQKMFKFIGRNMHYPSMAVENEIQGKVTVQFIVDKDGSIYDAAVLKGIGGGCDEEAVRVVKLLKFKPGRQNGQPVKVRFSLPIRFALN